MTDNIEIRKAKLEDLNSLYSLIEYWDEKVFHFENKYTKKILKKIIIDSEIIVAISNSKVISFYLINPFLDIGNVEHRKKIITKQISENKIPKGRYAYCLLSATHQEYFGNGLNRDALRLLCETAKDEYDYFIGIMYYDNIATQKSSLKMGWRHFGDVGFGLLAIIGTTDEKNLLLDQYI